jgi:hypothetical protein
MINNNIYYSRKYEDGLKYLREMVEQRIDSAYKYARINHLHAHYVISAIMTVNFHQPVTNTIKQLNPKLEIYSNPGWAVTMTREPEWMQNFELDITALQPTTDEKAINYMNK